MATLEAVHHFLKAQNKPCNLNDVVLGVPNEKSKTGIQHALEKLKKDKKIFEKVYGKQKIYCASQNTKYDVAELKRMNVELQAHANELEMKRKGLENDIKSGEEKLAALKSGPTLEEAIREKETIRQRVSSLEARLAYLVEKSGSQPNLGENKKRAEEQREKYFREYSKRKRMCTEIIDGILEGFPGTKKQLFENIGLEERIVK